MTNDRQPCAITRCGRSADVYVTVISSEGVQFDGHTCVQHALAKYPKVPVGTVSGGVDKIRNYVFDLSLVVHQYSTKQSWVTLYSGEIDRQIAVPIGWLEANSLRNCLVHPKATRLAHDAMLDIIKAFGATVERVVLSHVNIELRTYDSVVFLVNNELGYDRVVAMRPTDAMALAILADAKIFVSGEVVALVLDWQESRA